MCVVDIFVLLFAYDGPLLGNKWLFLERVTVPNGLQNKLEAWKQRSARGKMSVLSDTFELNLK
jgi:hypothetical protein